MVYVQASVCAVLLTACLPTTFGQSVGTVKPLRQAHAHNDYLHRRPLLDALDHGFCSAEADIFLQDGELRVAHFSFMTRPGVTLEKLYLDPLKKRVERNGSSVYPDSDIEFTLLIDIKRDGVEVFKVLHKTLQKYSTMLSGVENGKRTRRAVTVIISGDRPQAEIAAANPRWCGIDGRLSDLDSEKTAHLLPLISDKWSTHFKWRGEGPMPEEERIKLHDITKKAHAAGRRVRFWATPENEAVWKALLEAKVDLLNTDDLDGMQRFLTLRKDCKDPPN